MVEDILDLNKFDLIQDNVQVFEQADTQRLMQEVGQSLEAESMTPIGPPELQG